MPGPLLTEAQAQLTIKVSNRKVNVKFTEEQYAEAHSKWAIQQSLSTRTNSPSYLVRPINRSKVTAAIIRLPMTTS